MAEESGVTRQTLAIWLQAAGMLLTAIGIVASLAAFVIDVIGFAIGGGA